MTTYEITNEDKFNEVNDVDVTGLKWRGTDPKNNDLGYDGTIELYTEWHGVISSTGEHGSLDFEEQFGFKIIQN